MYQNDIFIATSATQNFLKIKEKREITIYPCGIVLLYCICSNGFFFFFTKSCDGKAKPSVVRCIWNIMQNQFI